MPGSTTTQDAGKRGQKLRRAAWWFLAALLVPMWNLLRSPRKATIRHGIEHGRKELAGILARIDPEDPQSRIDPGIREEATEKVDEILFLVNWLDDLGVLGKEERLLKTEMELRMLVYPREALLLRGLKSLEPDEWLRDVYATTTPHAAYRFRLVKNLWEQHMRDPQDGKALQALRDEGRWAGFFVRKTTEWLRGRAHEERSLLNNLGMHIVHIILGVETRAADADFLGVELVTRLDDSHRLRKRIEGSLPGENEARPDKTYEMLIDHLTTAARAFVRGMVLCQGNREARRLYLQSALDISRSASAVMHSDDFRSAFRTHPLLNRDPTFAASLREINRLVSESRVEMTAFLTSLSNEEDPTEAKTIQAAIAEIRAYISSGSPAGM